MKMKWIWIGGACLLVVIACLLVIRGLTGSKARRFENVTVNRDTIELKVQATGGVQAQNRLAIKPPVAGRIEDLLVNEGDSVRKGRILGWMSSTERVALIDAARGRGKEELKKWSELYKPTPLIAPMTGVVILRAMEPGQTVTTQDGVLVMADRLIVRTDVDETDIGRVKLGQGATITLDAYPDQGISGRVVHIAFDSKTVNNVTVYEVKVQPENIPDFMKSGMTANVMFSIERKENALVLPSEAIKSQGEDRFVLVPNKNSSGSPEQRNITIGIADGKKTEILSGIDEGQEVLIPTMKPVVSGSRPTNPFMPGRNARTPRR